MGEGLGQRKKDRKNGKKYIRGKKGQGSAQRWKMKQQRKEERQKDGDGAGQRETRTKGLIEITKRHVVGRGKVSG